MKCIEGFVLRKIGKEYILAGEGLGQVDFNQIISLSSSAAWLWQQVEGKEFGADTLAGLLCEHYEVDGPTAQRDAEEILNEWTRAQLIH